MVVIEMRENAYENAFELLDEAKKSAKKTKLTLCELEDAMYDCYETSKEDEEEHESEEEMEVEFRGRKGYRHEMYDDDADEHYGHRRSRSRGGIRMRRNRMGRFA